MTLQLLTNMEGAWKIPIFAPILSGTMLYFLAWALGGIGIGLFVGWPQPEDPEEKKDKNKEDPKKDKPEQKKPKPKYKTWGDTAEIVLASLTLALILGSSIYFLYFYNDIGSTKHIPKPPTSGSGIEEVAKKTVEVAASNILSLFGPGAYFFVQNATEFFKIAGSLGMFPSESPVAEVLYGTNEARLIRVITGLMAVTFNFLHEKAFEVGMSVLAYWAQSSDPELLINTLLGLKPFIEAVNNHLAANPDFIFPERWSEALRFICHHFASKESIEIFLDNPNLTIEFREYFKIIRSVIINAINNGIIKLK